MTELLLFLSLVSACIGLCLALDERDERADARRRNRPYRQARPRSWR